MRSLRSRPLTAAVVAAVAAGLCAPSANAAGPSDPEAAAQQPLQIMRVGKAVKKGKDPSGHASLIVSHVADIGQFLDKYSLGPPASSAFESIRRPAAQLGQACLVSLE